MHANPSGYASLRLAEENERKCHSTAHTSLSVVAASFGLEHCVCIYIYYLFCAQVNVAYMVEVYKQDASKGNASALASRISTLD